MTITASPAVPALSAPRSQQLSASKMIDSALLHDARRRAGQAEAALAAGDPLAARAAAREAVAVVRVVLGGCSPELASVLSVQAQAERLLGDVDEALACASEASAIMTAVAGGGALDRVRVRARRELAEVLSDQGEHAAARACFAAALRDAERTLGRTDLTTAAVLQELAGVDDDAPRSHARSFAIVGATAR
jgi:tetratricopeptide (TPR) repeat protein